MQSNPLDIVALLVALLAFSMSKDAAQIAGPYAAIAVMACAGAALSLSGVETDMSPLRGTWYIFVRVFLAIAVTVMFAQLIEKLLPYLQPRYTLAPIAFGIGWIRDYNSVRSWIGSLIQRYVSKRIEDGK